LLKQLAGDKLSRKVVESIDWLTSPEQVAEYIRDLSNTLWPGGFPACSQPLPPDSTRAIRATLARAKLIGSIPGRLACYLSCTRGREIVCLPSCCVYTSYLSADDLKRFIGGDRTAKGMARLFGMFQSQSLNCRLALRLLESLMDTLFPARDLKSTFRKLRTEITDMYSTS